MSSLKQKVDKHEEKWSKETQKSHRLLSDYYRAESTDWRNYEPDAAEIDQLLAQAVAVQEEVEKAQMDEQLNNEEIERVKKLIGGLVKRHKDLFDATSRHLEFLKKAKRKEKKLREQEKRKEQQERDKKQERERLQKERERLEEQMEEEAFKARRAMQLKFASHPAAKNLKFVDLRVLKHAVLRWQDRGLKHVTFSDFLIDIDEARVFYRMYQVDMKNESRYEVQICLPRTEAKGEAGVEQAGPQEEITLILDKRKSSIITVLRDDEEYDYETMDREYLE